MDVEPTNVAAVEAREVFAGLADPDFIERVLPTRLAPHYVREDRRRLIAVPPATDAGALIEGIRVWHEMGGGPPVFRTKRIVAVRGERLAIAHHEIVLADGTSTEFLILVQLDADCDLTERVIQFDVDAEASATEALDELAASLDTRNATATERGL